ncbi:MAG TPA: thioesterase family protein [Thermoanaerobaculia bacterium]
MLLLFRVLLVIIRNALRRRTSFDAESVMHTRVWPTDMDLNFHLNDGRYVSLTGLGRVDLMMRTGLLRKALKRGWYPVVGGITIQYRREIRAMEKFSVRTRIIGWDEKWFYFEHRFEKDGDLAAQSYARGVMRTRKGAVPAADVLALAGWDKPSPPLPDITFL